LKKFFIIGILLVLSSTALVAKNIYIHVLSTKNKTTIFTISSALEEHGYKMFATQYKSVYKIYTGPFKDTNQAQQSLIIIQKNITKNAKIVSVDLDAKGESLVAKELEPSQKSYVAQARAQNMSEDTIETQENPYRDTRFFIGLSGGFSKFDMSEKYTPTTIILDNQPKDAGYTYGVELGYYFNKSIFATLNYQRTDLENLYFDNVFASLNYMVRAFDSLSPYIGIIGGYNIMTWENYPLDTVISYENSSSFFTGLQVGNDIALGEYISIYMFYRYLKIENSTEIVTASSKGEIKHNNEQNFNLGLKFNF